MDDSFRVRVDKVFGSLSETSNLSSLWCLTDDEIAKKEWNRDPPTRELLDFDDSKPDCPPHIDGFFAKPHQTLATPPDLLQSDLDELTDGPEPDDDESNIRSCIGQDSTLDDEEEEDEVDKVAVGREKEKHLPSDRLYMGDISDYGISTNTYHELPLTLEDVKRDPRANHLAAKLRLQEDAAEAALTEGHFTSKFKQVSNLPPNSSVPDYVRNPSKYACYTFDPSDDMDEASNRKAYLDFLNLMKKRGQLEEDDSSTNFQKLPTFNPRVKQQLTAGPSNNQGIEGEQMQMKRTVPLSIATVESENTQVSAMEEDESLIAVDSVRPGSLKPGRRYRTRANMDTDDHNV